MEIWPESGIIPIKINRQSSNDMSDKEEELWSVGDGPQEMTSEERIKKVEQEADMNLAEREKAEKDEVSRLRRNRENADSRESWQNTPKEETKVAGEKTKSFRNFAMPHSTIFGSRGKTNAFKTTDKKHRLERYLNRHTNVSTKDRNAYLGALECFKSKRDGTLSVLGVKKMNRLMRTGEAGGDRAIKRAIDQMKEKGMIKDIKDVRKLVGKSAMRKMRQVMTKRPDPIMTARTRPSEGGRPMPGGGSAAPTRRS